MLQVSIFVELLRSQPRAMFWLATLLQALIWWLVPTVFYSAPPGELPQVLAVGHEFQLGTQFGPPLAFWLAEIAFRVAGLAGVYLLAQICVVVTYRAVFELGRAIVGIHHAVIAVYLMVGIAPLTLPTPDFGPSVLSMPLVALVALHSWRALGENRGGSWFLLAVDIGLLLLTTYAGVIQLVALILFTLATKRGRAMLASPNPWIAALVVAILVFPHLMWVDATGSGFFLQRFSRLLSSEAADTNLIEWLRMLGRLVLAHAGLALLVVLAAGWQLRRRTPAPCFARRPLDPFARRFVLFLALAPALCATLIAVVFGERAPIGGTAPYVMLSALAVVVVAGETGIAIHRQRIVGLAWSLLLLSPPLIVVLAIPFLPWIMGVEMKVALPAQEMGRYFGESFERRTGKPLEIVTGDPGIAALVALGAPSRPSVYDFTALNRTPWIKAEDVRRKGLVVVWPATTTAGIPPPEIKARFPDLVPEVPRAFEHAIQGRLPLVRLGWSVIRPQDLPTSGR